MDWNSYNIFKVTSADTVKTKNGFELFRLQLNGNIWTSKIVPFKEYERRRDKIFEIYSINSNIDPIIGTYISAYLEKTKYGIEIKAIQSLDPLGDFKKQLDDLHGNAFSTKLPIHQFLSDTNRNTQPDGSIQLQTKYGDMRILYSICPHHHIL